MAKTSQGCDTIRRDLERLRNLNERNLMKLNKGKDPMEQNLPLLKHLPSWLGGVSHPCNATTEGRSVTRMFFSRVGLPTVFPGPSRCTDKACRLHQDSWLALPALASGTTAGLGTAQGQPLPVLPFPCPAAQCCGFHRSLSRDSGWQTASAWVAGNTPRKFPFLPLLPPPGTLY